MAPSVTPGTAAASPSSGEAARSRASGRRRWSPRHGHTDARPYRDPHGYGNWELSADRANLARRILTGNGLADRQVSEVRGLADRQLRVKDDPDSPANRRIAITVLLDKPGAVRDSAAVADSIEVHRRST